MSGIFAKFQPYIGKLTYKKWVYITRYNQQFGNSGGSLWNVSLAAMGIAITIDSHARSQNAGSLEYNARKDNVRAHENVQLQFQRAASDLNIAELESAVYRSRTGKKNPGISSADGKLVFEHSTFPVVVAPFNTSRDLVPASKKA